MTSLNLVVTTPARQKPVPISWIKMVYKKEGLIAKSDNLQGSAHQTAGVQIGAIQGKGIFDNAD